MPNYKVGETDNFVEDYDYELAARDLGVTMEPHVSIGYHAAGGEVFGFGARLTDSRILIIEENGEARIGDAEEREHYVFP